jgi:hypothetical protein
MTSPRARHSRLTAGLVAVSAAILPLAFAAPSTGQTGKRKPNSPASLQSLDAKAQQIEKDYLTGLSELATGYEEAGQIDKAKEVLNLILQLKPDAKGAKDKLDALAEAVFDANSTHVEVDASKGWTAAGVLVARGEPVRFTGEGSYKFITNENLGPEGYPVQDPMKDMASGVPTGALMGIIVPPPRPGQRQPPKPGAPFAIGASKELKPDEDGVLFLKLNVPPGAKCIGKIKVAISGNIKRAP